ncbi:hypothetical protein [Microcystis phage vB_MweS-yong2]|nr:hypothetical protein [Microcystis phage vB_MweS-yong2]
MMGTVTREQTLPSGERVTVIASKRMQGQLAQAAAQLRRIDDGQREAFSAVETGQARSVGADPIHCDQLKSIVQRIERLEEEKKTIADDIKEVFLEAKANGYDVKVLRKVISIRKRDPRERQEEEAILDLYLQAVGETP